MTFVANLAILNFLFLICCIPIITVGPAITAMNYVVFKMRMERDIPIAKSFFKSFRQNFQQGVIIWLLMLLAGSLLGIDFYIVWYSAPSTVLRITVTIASSVYLMTLIYAFPLLARFNNTVFKTIRNATVLSVTSIPRTLSVLILIAVSIVGTLYSEKTVVYGTLLWLSIGFSGITYIISLVLQKTFRKYVQTGTETEVRAESETESEIEIEK